MDKHYLYHPFQILMVKIKKRKPASARITSGRNNGSNMTNLTPTHRRSTKVKTAENYTVR